MVTKVTVVSIASNSTHHSNYSPIVVTTVSAVSFGLCLCQHSAQYKLLVTNVTVVSTCLQQYTSLKVHSHCSRYSLCNLYCLL